MKTTDDGAAVTIEAAGTQLLRYVYRGDPEPSESPKPYVHPLRTLAGDVVTAYRPHDHRWHKGLQMTASHLSGDNLWGGGTYVRELGRYVDLDNHGVIRHDAFDVADNGRVVERLSWFGHDGELWLTEDRRITAAVLGEDVWELTWHTALTGRRAEPLRFGSPTTHGRPLAGYSGLTWRGPRSFTDGKVFGPDGRDEPELMGKAAPWLAFQGSHDEVDRTSTLVFTAEGDEDGPPTHWFVRSSPPLVNPSWAFHTEFTLAGGRTLSRSYRITLASGTWDRDRVESHLRQRGAAQ